MLSEKHLNIIKNIGVLGILVVVFLSDRHPTTSLFIAIPLAWMVMYAKFTLDANYPQPDIVEENDKLRGLLHEVKEACLFSEDEGVIGVTTEAHIDEDLFERICLALK